MTSIITKKLFLFGSIVAAAFIPLVTTNAQISTGTYYLFSRNSALNLDATGAATANGTPLDQWIYNAGTNQQWTVNSLGGGQYSIIGVGSGRAVDVKGVSTANDAICQLSDYHGGNNQKVTLTSRGSGFYSPVFVHSGKVMNVKGASTANGAAIVQYNNDGALNSQWRFQDVALAAQPQTNSSYYSKYLGNVNATKGKTIKLIFDGDSITDFWMGTGSSVWNANYSSKSAYDFGISADKTANLWWRLLGGESDGLNTQLVVLLIGTNDAGANVDNATIASRVTIIVNEYLTRCANAHLLLMGIFPRGHPTDTALRAKIVDINNRISSLNGTGGGRVIYKDIGSKFLNSDGTVNTSLLADSLHPSSAGYQVWANNIKTIVNQYVP